MEPSTVPSKFHWSTWTLFIVQFAFFFRLLKVRPVRRPARTSSDSATISAVERPPGTASKLRATAMRLQCDICHLAAAVVIICGEADMAACAECEESMSCSHDDARRIPLEKEAEPAKSEKGISCDACKVSARKSGRQNPYRSRF